MNKYQLITLCVKYNKDYSDLVKYAKETNDISELTELASCDDHKIQLAALKNSNINLDLLKALAKNSSLKIKTKLYRNNKIDPEVLYILAQDLDPYVKQQVTTNKNVDIKTLKLLMKDPNERVRAYVAAHSPKLDKEMIDHLMRDSRIVVITGLASRHDLELDCFYKILEKKEHGTTQTICFNNTTPSEVLDKIINSEIGHSYENYILQNKNCSLKTIEGLFYKKRTHDITYRIMNNNNTSKEILEQIYHEFKNKKSLANSRSFSINEMARHLNTPDYILKELALLNDTSINHHLITNKNTPTEALWHIRPRLNSSYEIKTCESHPNWKGAASMILNSIK